MKTFLLKIGTPDGLIFDGQVERVVCRCITGDMAVLAGHCNFCTALGMGEAHVVMEDGSRKSAACIGGMLSMMNGECSLMATTWEWQEEIDAERAEAARKRAEERIADKNLSEREQKLAEAKLKRALVRLSVKG